MYYYAGTCIFKYSTIKIQKLIDKLVDAGMHFCETKVLVFGDKSIFSFVIRGKWQACVNLDAILAAKTNDGYEFVIQPTSAPKAYLNTVPFILEGTAISNNFLLSKLFDFFSLKNIVVHKLSVDTFMAPRSNTEMLNCILNLHIPIDLNISTIKEDIYELMESLNIDGILQPERGVGG